MHAADSSRVRASGRGAGPLQPQPAGSEHVIQAVCFDLWNTLVFEGAGGLLRPRSIRWREVLAECGIDADLDALDAAHDATLAEYKEAWHAGEQFRSPEAARAASRHLGLDLDAAVLRRLEGAFHVAGLDSALDVVPGALSTLEQLRSAGVRTAIICDIGLTPSSALRSHLQDEGLLELIDVEAWSDILGWYKPNAAIFDWTLEQLGVDPSTAMHVGDRKRTDVAGARGAGMLTVRFTGIYDDPDDLEEADIVLGRLEDTLDLVRTS